MNMVTLRTGVEVPEPVLYTTTVTLERMFEAGQVIALFELVEMCKNPAHVPFANTGEILEKFALISGGRVHDVVRDIVLASVDGEDLDFALVNPVQG